MRRFTTQSPNSKRQKPSRGPLRSLKVSASLRDFVLDQLQHGAGLRARSMCSGIGLYAEEVFFGIVAADTLFFKVDDSNRRDYEAAGSVLKADHEPA